MLTLSVDKIDITAPSQILMHVNSLHISDVQLAVLHKPFRPHWHKHFHLLF